MNIGSRSLVTFFVAAILILMAGCAVTVTESNRVLSSPEKAKSIALIWVYSSKTRLFSAPGIAPLPRVLELQRYTSEHNGFGEALKKRISGGNTFKNSYVDFLDLSNSSADLVLPTLNYPPDVAILILEPEWAVRYNFAGLYSFKVRIKYYEPGTKNLVFSAVFDLPPRAFLNDPIDTMVEKFEKSMAELLKAEKLMPN
jgi:hypothetical protein